MFGATGDLARRKLLPGLLHLFQAGLLPPGAIVGTSLDEHDRESFVEFTREAVDEFSRPPAVRRASGTTSPAMLRYVPGSGGAAGAGGGGRGGGGASCDGESRRLHYLSVPPKAALAVVHLLDEAELVERSRIIMEKPFGTDLASAQKLNAELHEVFDEEQIFRIDHFLGKEAAQNILAFRFANGLFEPIWNRNHIDHVQIDVPGDAGPRARAPRSTRPPAPTATWSSPTCSRCWRSWRWSRRPRWSRGPISEEKNKVFRSMLPIEPHNVVRGQYVGYREIDGVAADSDTETFIALKCEIDNWRWAGVPFYLRTGKRLAEGARIISIAFKEPPRRMFPPGSGVGPDGPDHLTFDLADPSRMSLSFYGKRPGPGMKLDKLSMQFAMHDTGWAGSVLEAYERLIHDAMRGDHTLFTTAEGIERLWEVSTPLLDNPPPVRAVPGGSGARTRSTSWSPRTPGGCRSSGPGATPTCTAPDRPTPARGGDPTRQGDARAERGQCEAKRRGADAHAHRRRQEMARHRMRGDEHTSYDGAPARRCSGRATRDRAQSAAEPGRRRPLTSTRCCTAVGTSCCWSPRPCSPCRCRRSRSASWPGSSGCSSWSGRGCRTSSAGPLRRPGCRCRCWPSRASRSVRPSGTSRAVAGTCRPTAWPGG